MRTPSDPIERFLSKVKISSNSECWTWIAAKTSLGHGTFWVEGRNVMAHRVAWELHYGKDPGDAMVVHKCGNNDCVNPHHLVLGDLQIKQQIVTSLGKQGAIGKHYPKKPRKLSLEQIGEIKELYKNSELTTSEIADRFGISQQYVCRIGRR